MSELTEFLLARIDEDESQAHDASLMGGDRLGTHVPVYALGADRGGVSMGALRMLVECAAKRQIVKDFLSLREVAEHVASEQGVQSGDAATSRHMYMGLLMAISHLAAVYADHPDYREGWPE